MFKSPWLFHIISIFLSKINFKSEPHVIDASMLSEFEDEWTLILAFQVQDQLYFFSWSGHFSKFLSVNYNPTNFKKCGLTYNYNLYMYFTCMSNLVSSQVVCSAEGFATNVAFKLLYPRMVPHVLHNCTPCTICIGTLWAYITAIWCSII